MGGKMGGVPIFPKQEKAVKSQSISRREFHALAGAALPFTILKPELVRGTQANSKMKLGLVGCGGRGNWIAALFQKHGGYELTAGADYFPAKAEAFGAKFAVPSNRLFSGLSGYRRLLESGVEVLVIQSPPYFHPEQAAAGVEAGAHVYLAKPVAVDVPGCQSITASAQRATVRKRAFLVDFQTRANPLFIEALRRIHEGAIGELVFGEALYHAECPFEQWYEIMKNDPGNPENRIRGWGLDRALSGDMITEQDIHTLDVMSWIMGKPPLHAIGTGGLTARPKIGSCWDHFVVHYRYPSGVAVQFSGRQFKGHGTTPQGIRNRMFGSKGVLETEYGGEVLVRGENFYRGGKTSGIYQEGAVANIAAFLRGHRQGGLLQCHGGAQRPEQPGYHPGQECRLRKPPADLG
jgi:myo-inositol 2-dehydrogenase / D-chiro-inositol 1-dehydrogenase